MMLKIFTVLAIGCALLSGIPADAQKKSDNRLPRETRQPANSTTQTLVQSSSEVEAVIQAPDPVERYVDVEVFSAHATDLRNTANVTHRGARLSALQSFSLKFQNGDHQVRAVGIMNNGHSITTTFRDEDGDDPYTVDARYVSFGEFQREARYITMTADRCEVRCTLRIEGMQKGETALLAGFEFDRNQHDANLRAISVEVLPDREVVNVVFFDDRGPDFSGFLPLPVYDAVKTIDGAAQYPRFYSAKVQVLIVPEKILRGVTRIIGSSREAANDPDALVPDKDRDGLTRHFALMGFGLSFKRADHFIETLGVDHWESPSVHFQDGDTDDPIAWFYDLAMFERTVDWP